MNNTPFSEPSLHFLFMACHTKFQRLYMEAMNQQFPEGDKLLPGQPKILEFLKMNPNAYQRQIADGCLLEPSTLSLILGKMEKDSKLITRSKSNNNNKNSVVSLTDKGKEMAERAISIFSQLEARIQEKCTEQEKRMVKVILRKIYEQETYLLDGNEEII
ncbi:winged helix-turn-helix transcriptional regulator [bacterium]|nr:winged helix-turn-helix transcriptional regulator [bacterium]